MCEGPDHAAVDTVVSSGGTHVVVVDDLMSYAREICHQAEVRRTAPGFIGYGATKPGDRALVAVDTHYDKRVVEAVARGLREMGASVDVITVEVEPDRPFTTTDEVEVVMRREPWSKKPRRWEGLP